MTDQVERAIPATCPSCGHTIATGYRNHCAPDKWCGWIVCDGCNAVVDTPHRALHHSREASRMTGPDPWTKPEVHTVDKPGADTPPPPNETEEEST